MNLLALRTEVLAKGFDPIVFSSRINQYLNDGMNLVARRVDYYVDESSLQVTTAAASPYFSLPADFARARTLTNTDLQQEIQFVALRDIDRSSLASGTPMYYAFNGQGIELYPTPDGVHTLLLRYWMMPKLLVNDTDVPSLPVDWHHMLHVYATWMCYEAEDDASMGQYWEGRFEKELAMFAADQKFPDSDGPTVARGMWDQQHTLGGGNAWTLYGSGF